MTMIDPKILTAELKKAFGPETENLDEETVRCCLEAGQQVAQGKMRIKDVLQIPDQHMKLLCSVAYQLYKNNKVERACKMFTMLCTYDPITPKYWEGLGATLRLLKKYNEAIAAYHILTQLRALKISYYLDLADCFIKINQPEVAEKCCEAVIFMAGNKTFKAENSDAADCLEKAKSLQRILKK